MNNEVMFFRMGNIQIFQLIERKKLHEEVLQHIEKLMSIDQKVRFLREIVRREKGIFSSNIIIFLLLLSRFPDEHV
jgi:hypothetical protein